MSIQYLKGDVTNPIGQDQKIIIHICNDIGGWGRGFVLALSKKWKQSEVEYKKWYKSKNNFKLGEVQFVKVEEEIIVANMIGQYNIYATNGIQPIRYDEVDKCLGKVAKEALKIKASIHMPRIGCGLAGGTWDKIEPLIQKNLVNNGVKVFVYDLD
jgi:O-acetyl-ADP-ribose deacetylase (regulator of RNase III)